MHDVSHKGTHYKKTGHIASLWVVGTRYVPCGFLENSLSSNCFISSLGNCKASTASTFKGVVNVTLVPLTVMRVDLLFDKLELGGIAPVLVGRDLASPWGWKMGFTNISKLCSGYSSLTPREKFYYSKKHFVDMSQQCISDFF